MQHPSPSASLISLQELSVFSHECNESYKRAPQHTLLDSPASKAFLVLHSVV